MPGITVRLGKRSQRDGDVVWLEGTDLVIGRSRDCDLTLLDDSISRHHCKIQLQGDRWIARDMGSQNGLYVNKREIRAEEIRPGDDLLLGPTGPHLEILALNPAPGLVDPHEAPTRAIQMPQKPASPKHQPPPKQRPPRQGTPKQHRPEQRTPKARRPAPPRSPPPRERQQQPRPQQQPQQRPEPKPPGRAAPPPPPRERPAAPPPPPEPNQIWPPPAATPAATPSRGMRVVRWMLLLVLVLGVSALAYVQRAQLPGYWRAARTRIAQWTATSTDSPEEREQRVESGDDDTERLPPPPVDSEPVGQTRADEAGPGGRLAFLQLVTTVYSRAGKSKGDRLDVVVTTARIPVRVSADRTLESALTDARAALAGTAKLDEAEVRAWLAQPAGEQLVISSELSPADARAAEADTASNTPIDVEPRREVREGSGPPW